MREIARLFGISTSTTHRCIRRVSEALCMLQQTIIKWPDLEMQQTISEGIEEKSGIPNVIGFIDGTHIRLAGVLEGDTNYVNRKGYASVILQLIVDDQLMILDCYVGWPGSTHDARVYRNSPIRHGLESSQAPLERETFIIGRCSRLMIVAINIKYIISWSTNPSLSSHLAIKMVISIFSSIHIHIMERFVAIPMITSQLRLFSWPIISIVS